MNVLTDRDVCKKGVGQGRSGNCREKLDFFCNCNIISFKAVKWLLKPGFTLIVGGPEVVLPAVFFRSNSNFFLEDRKGWSYIPG